MKGKPVDPNKVRYFWLLREKERSGLKKLQEGQGVVLGMFLGLIAWVCIVLGCWAAVEVIGWLKKL